MRFICSLLLGESGGGSLSNFRILENICRFNFFSTARAKNHVLLSVRWTCGSGLCIEHASVKTPQNHIYTQLGRILSKCLSLPSILLNTMFHAPTGRFQLELIYYFTYFSTVIPFNICVLISCRPFVVNTTFSAGLVVLEVSSVSWLGQWTVGV